MTNRRRCSSPAVFQFGAIGAVLLCTTPALAAWQNGFKWGGSMGMDLYVPTNVDASPGIVVTLHYCGGNSGNAHSWLQDAADKYGFILIAPQAGGNCFDANPARSGERDSIAKMVAAIITQNKADASKVFAAGASSGACMTQALLAAYPEVFAGGSVLAGVPAGAWTGGNAYGWTTPASRSAADWGDIVRKASMTFTGTRPRIQLWHGTGDTTLTYSQNFPAEVLQWTNVLGVSDANSTTSSYKGSQDTWARISYKNAAGTLVMETNVAQNAPHDLSGRGLWPEVVRFFGLDTDTPSGNGGAGGSSSTGGAGGSGGKANGGGGTGGSVAAVAGAGGKPAAGAGGAGSGNAAGAPSNVAGGPSAGGAPSAGGTGPAAGGSKPSTGGSTMGTGGSPSSDGGCSVGHNQSSGASLVAVLMAGLAAAIRRRRSPRG